jgi:hypothetical protein
MEFGHGINNLVFLRKFPVFEFIIFQELALKLFFLQLDNLILLLLKSTLIVGRLHLGINELLLELLNFELALADLDILARDKFKLLVRQLADTDFQLHDLRLVLVDLGVVSHFLDLQLHLLQLQVMFELQHFKLRFFKHR